MKFAFIKRFFLLLTLFLAGIVYIWKLWNEGLANLYYSAGVFSMGQSLHAFFYNSVDSIGFISIDKPPLGLWIQVLFTKVLGFEGMAVLLPEALSGVFSVYLIYKIMDRRFGQIAGLVSALVLALTPILAAVCRNNTIDGILILMLVLASKQAVEAAEKSSLKNLIIAGIFIGLGFNVKMLQAYMIVPAVYLTYFTFSKEKLFKKIISSGLSAAILIIISFSWVAAVDLTPPQDRPYIGSSGTNSELHLVFGNNGMGRLIRRESSGLNNNNPYPASEKGEGKDRLLKSNDPLQKPPPPAAIQNAPNRPRAEGGNTSLLRLLNNETAGQISWFLLPSFLASMLCLYRLFRNKLAARTENITLFYFTMCFIPMLIYFSFSNGMAHRYYLAMLSFPIAGIIGTFSSIILGRYRRNKVVIPIIFIIAAGAQLYIQSLYKEWINWILPLCSVLFLVTLILILAINRKEVKKEYTMLLMSVLLLLPGIWSFTPIICGNNAQIPIAGPELLQQGDAFDRHPDLSELIIYLKAYSGNAEFIASVPSAMDMGAELILQSREPVLVLGGFNGGDHPITLEKYKNMIRMGKVKYAIVTNDNNIKSSRDVEEPGDKINSWIIENGILVNRKFYGFSLYELPDE